VGTPVCKKCKKYLYVCDCDNDSSSEEVKVVFKPERGKNDIYFNGKGKPDGKGHSHVVIDDNGNRLYVCDKDTVIEDSGRYI